MSEEPLVTPTTPPITETERRTLLGLRQRLRAYHWWADFEHSHSWRLFRAMGESEHGYQVLKAPTPALARHAFEAYWPTHDESLYIVAALNAIPRYEALVQQLQARLDALTPQEVPDGDARRE